MNRHQIDYFEIAQKNYYISKGKSLLERHR